MCYLEREEAWLNFWYWMSPRPGVKVGEFVDRRPEAERAHLQRLVCPQSRRPWPGRAWRGLRVCCPTQKGGQSGPQFKAWFHSPMGMISTPENLERTENMWHCSEENWETELIKDERWRGPSVSAGGCADRCLWSADSPRESGCSPGSRWGDS